MKEIEYSKKDIYELICEFMNGKMDEIEFSDKYYFIFNYNSNYWNNTDRLCKKERLLFKKMAEIVNYLVSFTEIEATLSEIFMLKEKLKDAVSQIYKQLFIYFLLEQFMHKELSTKDFCDGFYKMYDVGDMKDEMDRITKDAFNELSMLTGRYSEFENDHMLDPKAYTMGPEIRKKVEEILAMNC